MVCPVLHKKVNGGVPLTIFTVAVPWQRHPLSVFDAVILSDRIEFAKAISEDNEPQKGYALVFDVPNDFEN